MPAEPCQEHTGIVKELQFIRKDQEFLREKMDKVEDGISAKVEKVEDGILSKFETLNGSIVNMKLETARKSARVGVTWAGILLGGFEAVKWIVANGHSIKAFFVAAG